MKDDSPECACVKRFRKFEERRNRIIFIGRGRVNISMKDDSPECACVKRFRKFEEC